MAHGYTDTTFFSVTQILTHVPAQTCLPKQKRLPAISFQGHV